MDAKPACPRLAAITRRAQSRAMVHPIIELFEQRAALLDLQGDRKGLDDAISNLAAWMELMRDYLSEDDWAVLGEIGGVLYREGLRRRSQP